MQPPERSRALRGEGVFGKAPRTPCWARLTGVAETPGGNPAILPFDAAALRAAKQLQQHEPGATRLGPTPTPRAPHEARRMTTHRLGTKVLHAHRDGLSFTFLITISLTNMDTDDKSHTCHRRTLLLLLACFSQPSEH